MWIDVIDVACSHGSTLNYTVSTQWFLGESVPPH